jgi:hypothetical protein
LLGALALCDSARCLDEESATDRADALVAAGRPAEAIDALTHAVSLVRRSGGLYDPRQYALLSQLVDLHSLQSDIAAALEALAYMEVVSERIQGPQSTAHASRLAGIGEWYCRLGRFDNGRERLRRSVELLRAVENATLINALLGVALRHQSVT